MTSEHWETIRAILIVLGGLATGVVTSRVTRKSQKESSNIALATDLINQVQEERDGYKTDAKSVTDENKMLRRYIRQLRSQIYELGGKPVEPDEKLGI
jgi:flagellar hook protein FlgE